jgi:hypothetical protein
MFQRSKKMTYKKLTWFFKLYQQGKLNRKSLVYQIVKYQRINGIKPIEAQGFL